MTGGSLFSRGLDGPAVERELAIHMARKALPVVPVLMILAAIPWGWPGVLSTAYAAGLVVVNMVVAATLMASAARRSLGLLMIVALGGYVVRLALVTVAVLAVIDQGWVEPVPLGLTLIVTHLGLLFWETRYVSASLAFPGLRPDAGRTATAARS
jgi:hypothetical protein